MKQTTSHNSVISLHIYNVNMELIGNLNVKLLHKNIWFEHELDLFVYKINKAMTFLCPIIKMP